MKFFPRFRRRRVEQLPRLSDAEPEPVWEGPPPDPMILEMERNARRVAGQLAARSGSWVDSFGRRVF